MQDFEAILLQTRASLVKQCVQALLATEAVTLDFTADGITRLAQIAYDVNERTENIGARRLATVMERLFDDVSFDAVALNGQTYKSTLRTSKPAWDRSARTRISRYIL